MYIQDEKEKEDTADFYCIMPIDQCHHLTYITNNILINQ